MISKRHSAVATAVKALGDHGRVPRAVAVALQGLVAPQAPVAVSAPPVLNVNSLRKEEGEPRQREGRI